MTKPTLYTVARSDGEDREYNLTLAEAARAILQHDGGDYKICPASDGEGFWLSARVHRNFPWSMSTFSAASDYDAAESDIFQQLVDKSGCDGWRGLVAEDQSSYRAMLERMRSDYDPVEDADEIAGIDAELAEINT